MSPLDRALGRQTGLPSICIDEAALDRLYNTRIRASDSAYIAWRASIGRDHPGWWQSCRVKLGF